MLQQLVPATYNYEDIIDFLIGLGVPEPQIREWSMHKEAMGGRIPNPQRLVIQRLNHFNLQSSNLMVTGYSLSLNADTRQPSCENRLPNLSRVGFTQIDFALLDGWHDFE